MACSSDSSGHFPGESREEGGRRPACRRYVGKGAGADACAHFGALKKFVELREVRTSVVVVFLGRRKGDVLEVRSADQRQRDWERRRGPGRAVPVTKAPVSLAGFLLRGESLF